MCILDSITSGESRQSPSLWRKTRESTDSDLIWANQIVPCLWQLKTREVWDLAREPSVARKTRSQAGAVDHISALRESDTQIMIDLAHTTHNIIARLYFDAHSSSTHLCAVSYYQDRSRANSSAVLKVGKFVASAHSDSDEQQWPLR